MIRNLSFVFAIGLGLGLFKSWAFAVSGPIKIIPKQKLKPELRSTFNVKKNIPDCEALWKDQGIDGQYDFATEGKFEALGNTGYADYLSRLHRNDCLKEWTVLIYMAGDNDLSPYALWDLAELEQLVPGEKNLGATTLSRDVLVELDTRGRSEGRRRLHMFQTQNAYDPELGLAYYRQKSAAQIQSPIVEHFSEQGERFPLWNQAQRFEDFLAWGMQQYPARHYMVVVWGHGEGYVGKYSPLEVKQLRGRYKDAASETRPLPGRLLSREHLEARALDMPDYEPKQFPVEKIFGGVAFDYSDASFLDIPSIKDALHKMRQLRDDKRPVDLFAFDACLMQSLEVAAELSYEVSYLLGSTQIQNYLGLPYKVMLDHLSLEPRPYEFVRRLTPAIEAAYQSGTQSHHDSKAYETLTASVLRLAEFRQNLTPKFRQFAAALYEYLQEDPLRGLDMEMVLAYTPAFLGETRDLGIFLGSIERMLYEEKLMYGESSQAAKLLKNKIIELWRAVGMTVVDQVYGPFYVPSPERAQAENYYLGYFKGLSLWVPSNRKLFLTRQQEFFHSLFYTNELRGKINPWPLWLETNFTSR